MKERRNRTNVEKRKKTSTVSFRIDAEYDKILRIEAEEKKVSLNTLVNQIFGEYVDWNRYVKQFGTIVLSRDAFKLILNNLEEDKIINLAIDIATKAPEEFILFKWKEITFENVIGFIKMFFDHCGYGNYNYHFDEDNQTHGFSIRHELGHKGSVFLKAYIESVIKHTLKSECKSIITENSVTVVF